MGQIKNIKLHIVTDIKVIIKQIKMRMQKILTHVLGVTAIGGTTAAYYFNKLKQDDIICSTADCRPHRAPNPSSDIDPSHREMSPWLDNWDFRHPSSLPDNATEKEKKDSYDLLVCHGNVIRYFVCRALQFPPEGWLRMSVANCGITWISIRPTGRVSLRGLGDVGHLPSDMITYN